MKRRKRPFTYRPKKTEPPAELKYRGYAYWREDIALEVLNEERENALQLAEELEDEKRRNRTRNPRSTAQTDEMPEPQVKRVRLRHWPRSYLGLIVDNEEKSK